MSWFAPHGDFKVEIDHRLVVIQATGPFNAELAHGFNAVGAKLRACMQGTPWAVLVIGRGDFLLVPEAEAVLSGAEPSYDESGRCATAFVIPTELRSRIIETQWRRVYREARTEPRFFDDADAARDWLQHELARAAR